MSLTVLPVTHGMFKLLKKFLTYVYLFQIVASDFTLRPDILRTSRCEGHDMVSRTEYRAEIKC